MEELLNKLIQKGWKPFGWDDKLSSFHKEYGVGKWYIRFHNGMDSELFDLRQLTSKESGLWQFVCENKLEKKMEKNPKGIWINSWVKSAYESCPVYIMVKYEYRLIESALCNEKDLEKFLLDNIKVGK